MFEYLVGHESHSSNSGKFFVRGFESTQCQKDHEQNKRDNHHTYQFYMADAQPGTIFTIFEKKAWRITTEVMKFSICKVAQGEAKTIKAGYGLGFITGSFEVIAIAETTIKAKRLIEWWRNKPEGANPEAYAIHCAQHITRRGLKTLPPLPAP